MKIAVLSNIHANLPALEAVLQHAQSQGVDAIWNLGDVVGYHPFPDRVVRRLREVDAVSVLGNFDRRLLKFNQKKAKWRETKRSEDFLAFQWGYENLSQVSRTYLEELPRQVKVRLGKVKILLVHGSPESIKEKLDKDTRGKRFKELAREEKVDLILCGNSHHPFYRTAKRTHFINPGSVGSPFDGDPRAAYTLLELDSRLMLADPAPELAFEHRVHRVTYNLDASLTAIREAGLPEAYAQCLLQGRDLDTVMRRPETWEGHGPEDESWWITTFKSLASRQEEEDRRIHEVLQLAEKQGCDLEHVQQAAHLALRLFDQLQPLHRLGPDERYWLRCGSLLHDIGKPEGNKGHHKTARDLILEAPELPFPDRERKIIGLIARYHRKAWPKEKHDQFVSLPAVDQRKVTILSSLLRVADGLDSPRRGNVQDIEVYFSPEDITIKCRVEKQAKKEKKRALGKGELMEFAFDRDLYIEWHRI